MTSRRSPVSNINRKIALLRQSFGLLSLYVSMSWRQRDGARGNKFASRQALVGHRRVQYEARDYLPKWQELRWIGLVRGRGI